MANVMFRQFFFGMSSDVPALKVPVFAMDFEFWSKGILIENIPTQNFAHHVVIH